VRPLLRAPHPPTGRWPASTSTRAWRACRAPADAKKLDTKQDGELDRMMTMLETQYKDPYTPKITAGNQAMIDALKGKTGDDYQKTFYLDVVQHHQEAIKMIDGYLATAKDPVVKAMAEKMKADQTKEIAEFQRKAATS
jgi:uncharacterized protein (DUF305 family)